MEYLDFELRISARREDGAHAVTAESDLGRVEGAAQFDQARLDQLRAELVGLINPQLRRVSPAFAKAKEFGMLLFSSLPPEVREHYARLRERVAEESGVRLKLDVQDPRLALLPWEFLYYDNGFLVDSVSTPLVRWPTHSTALKSLRDSKMRVLVVIADPINAPVPNVDEEKNRLRQVLGNNSSVELSFLDELVEHVTLESVQAELRRARTQKRRYHVLHFVGHGVYERRGAADEGEGYLIFEGPNGRAAKVSDGLIEAVVGDHPLRLVVLNACEGAQVDDNDALAGVASSLVRAGIPAVVAMQFVISGGAAVAFAGEFYQSILDGYPVDAAVAEGRKAILVNQGEDSIEWGTPVLFTSYVDGQLLKIPPKKPPARAPAAEPEPAVLVPAALEALQARPAPPVSDASQGPSASPASSRPPIPSKRRVGRIDTKIWLALIPVLGAIAVPVIQKILDSLPANAPTATPTPTVAVDDFREADLPDSDPEKIDEMMRFIPAESFKMGDNQGPDSAARPAHTVTLDDGFYIDQFEVTNLQYQRFVVETDYPPPPLWDDNSFPSDQAGQPVVSVNWFDALAYCEWVGKRLPTEAEWELAARGTERRLYPWGDEWLPLANSLESGLKRPVNVGSYSPAGDSVYGIADMAGNVMEWVSTLYRSYPYKANDGREDLDNEQGTRVLRGGSWALGAELARTTFRIDADPQARSPEIGFRCASSSAP